MVSSALGERIGKFRNERVESQRNVLLAVLEIGWESNIEDTPCVERV